MGMEQGDTGDEEAITPSHLHEDDVTGLSIICILCESYVIYG